MEPLPLNAKLTEYALDLTFTSAALRAGGHAELAGSVDKALAEISAQVEEDARLTERATVAQAELAGKDAALDELYKQASNTLREKHPSEYGRFFPKPVARVAEGDLTEEIDAVRALVAELVTLDAGDALRTELRPRLERALADVEAALRARDAVLQEIAPARSALEDVRAKANDVRAELHAKLADATHDKKTPDKFFRR